ncbi:MAG: 2-oxo acid dehydrogenase subunit E2 [Chloroflexi bacterium]|uniref:2-oxo acid dehydrogenase subunit E2 n=1 Tax=Candidatus Flexifilum breve TaxID=3140694 RepID=UPI0031361C57|nr:2-oxo acid dehydrogenase subunit E2 [Chloroflexota bacterium]
MVPVAVMLTLGGMAKKPAVVDGRIEIRDLLCVTVSFDHAITDGAPAARFTSRLKQLIEGGSGLEVCRSAVSTEVDSDIVSKQVSASSP